MRKWRLFRGVNSTGDAGDASPAIFGQPGTEYLISPPKFVIVVFIIVNSALTVHIIWRNGWRKNASKCTDLDVTIQNCFGGYASRTPVLGRGYGAPPQTPSSWHSGAARLPDLARGLNRPPMFVSRWYHCVGSVLVVLWVLLLWKYVTASHLGQVSL